MVFRRHRVPLLQPQLAFRARGRRASARSPSPPRATPSRRTASRCAGRSPPAGRFTRASCRGAGSRSREVRRADDHRARGAPAPGWRSLRVRGTISIARRDGRAPPSSVPPSPATPFCPRDGRRAGGPPDLTAALRAGSRGAAYLSPRAPRDGARHASGVPASRGGVDVLHRRPGHPGRPAAGRVAPAAGHGGAGAGRHARGANVLDWVPREGIVQGVGQLGLLLLMFLAGWSWTWRSSPGAAPRRSASACSPSPSRSRWAR